MGPKAHFGSLVYKVFPTPERLFKQRRLRRLRKQRSREQLARSYLRLHLLFVFFDLRSLPTERYETYLTPRRFQIGPIREYTVAAADYRVHNAREEQPSSICCTDSSNVFSGGPGEIRTPLLDTVLFPTLRC
jgi:hypothetical protein